MKNYLYNGFLKIFELFKDDRPQMQHSVSVLLVKVGSSLEEDQFYVGTLYPEAQDITIGGLSKILPEGGCEYSETTALRMAMEEAGASGHLEYTRSYYKSSTCTNYQFIMFVDKISSPTHPVAGVEWKWRPNSDFPEYDEMGSNGFSPLGQLICRHRNYRELYIGEWHENTV